MDENVSKVFRSCILLTHKGTPRKGYEDTSRYASYLETAKHIAAGIRPSLISVTESEFFCRMRPPYDFGLLLCSDSF